jgi:hypothetical protein
LPQQRGIRTHVVIDVGFVFVAHRDGFTELRP